uniref:Uncharacterized protein n=1 Tax=Hippocampus comes TaxID=109280 RepID=A0A3Q2YDH9_HIPCM
MNRKRDKGFESPRKSVIVSINLNKAKLVPHPDCNIMNTCIV